jgi:hypothetical protein
MGAVGDGQCAAGVAVAFHETHARVGVERDIREIEIFGLAEARDRPARVVRIAGTRYAIPYLT